MCDLEIKPVVPGFEKSEAPKASNFNTMKLVTSGLLLPHEIFGSLYNYQNGHLFFSLLAGLPGASWQHSVILFA